MIEGHAKVNISQKHNPKESKPDMNKRSVPFIEKMKPLEWHPIKNGAVALCEIRDCYWEVTQRQAGLDWNISKGELPWQDKVEHPDTVYVVATVNPTKTIEEAKKVAETLCQDEIENAHIDCVDHASAQLRETPEMEPFVALRASVGEHFFNKTSYKGPNPDTEAMLIELLNRIGEALDPGRLEVQAFQILTQLLPAPDENPEPKQPAAQLV